MRTSGAVQLRDLTREFIRQGHELTVILPAQDLDKPWELSEFHGAQVLRLSAPKTKDVGYVKRTLGEWLMPYVMRHNLKKTSLAENSWDGVLWYSPSIFHAPLVHALKRRSGCKSYLIIRDIFPEWALDIGLMRPGLAYAFFKLIAQQQYEAADIIGVQSPGNLSYFEAWHQNGAGRRLEVLQNWLASPLDPRHSFRIDDTSIAGRKIFIYAGNMGIAQGLDIVIDLAKRMRFRRDIGFLFVGRGSEVGRLQTRCKELNLDNIIFRPEIEPDAIPGLYAQCAAGIVSLDQRHKSHNIPGKFLTYMQNGLPTLAIVNPGNDLAALIREEGVGEVCETHDLQDLERLTDSLVHQIEQDEPISERCVRLFERQFSVSQPVRQIVAALKGSV